MERKSELPLFAAKAVMSLLKLAVLFFFFPAFGAAQGLKLDLHANNNSCSYHKPGPADPGLSLAFKELPLLKNKVCYARTVKINYEDKIVELKDKLGNYPVDNVFPLSLDSYMSYTLSSQYQDNWRKNTNLSLTQTQQGQRRSFFQFDIPVKFPSIVSKFIGEGGPSLKITGNRKISFSGKSHWTEGLVKTATYKPSKWPSLNMEQKYSFKINGNVGSKISVDVDQNSETTTDLANRIHLRYTGEEDEVLQSIELGNTNLAVGNSLVGYSQAIRGLFGIKATAKVGRMGLTMITSQEKSSTQRTTFKAGSESAASYIRDYEYEKRRFYYLGRSSVWGDTINDFQPRDSLIEFELYKRSDSLFSILPHGYACVNPISPKQDSTESKYCVFEHIDKDDYYLYPIMTRDSVRQTVTLPFVELNSRLGETAVLAYYAKILRRASVPPETITVGSLKYFIPTNPDSLLISDTTFLLKLLKPDDSRPDQITWEYEWRNVYSFGARNIEKDGLKINIYKGAYTNNTDPDQQNTVRYIQILGLDNIDQYGIRNNPDGVVDFDRIDFNKGLLFFPDRHPFDADPQGKTDTLNEKIPEIYTTTENNQFAQILGEKSKYYIYVETKSRKTEYALGHAPIIEGSEVVTLNGKALTKGRDYNIDYDFGQITFLAPEATDPTAELKIDYEYAPFLMAEKKSLYGLQAKYVSAGGLSINSVALYKSEKSTDERPRIGEEQKKNFVWGTDLAFSLTPSIMTKMADALPLFGTEEPSRVDINLQLAQSIPNPNLINKAYIDDFEGSLEYTDLGIRRGNWALSSMPQGNWQRARMIWYNPYDRVQIRDIWPNRQFQAREGWTDVLNLELYPKQPQAPRDTLADTTLGIRNFYPDSSYRSSNGVMRPFATSSWDQTRTKFLEIWVKGDENTILNIDLGEISEDINGDGIRQTEDRPTFGQRGNGVLDEDPDEDTGLDGLFEDSSGVDWSGDDWYYNPEQNKHDYSHINGTQKNADDPDRGRRPDTEDINGNDDLDKINNYFEFPLNLKDNSLWVPGTFYNGWRLYRIPLDNAQLRTSVGTPDFSKIKFARIWLSSSDTTGKTISVQIASIQLVSNRWRSSGVMSMNDSTFGPVDSTRESFEVFVINTYDNNNYVPPPGIAGILDRNTDVREKEQSLALKYQHLKYGHYGSAYRKPKAEDYTNYQGLKMFVNWQPEPGNTTKTKFFYRMGTDSLNFYEYHSDLNQGWDSRNEVNMDFSQMTALKNYMLMSASKDSTAAKDTTQGNYRVKGDPRLNQITWFNIGVYTDTLQTDSADISGEIWVDELRVTDVRKVPGWYYTGSVSTKFADLFSLGVSFSRQDADFYGLTDPDSKGTGSVSTGLGISFSTYFEKFLPASWGLSLPFSFNLKKTLDLPRLKPGSDVILPAELRSRDRTETTAKSFSFQPAFNRETKNWFLKLTLKRLKLSQSIYYTRNDLRSTVTPISNSQSYGFGLQYDMTPRKGLSFSPFKGLKSVFLLKKLATETISPFPTNLIFTSSVRGLKSFSQSSAGNITSQYTRDFTGSITAAMVPLRTVQLNYTFETLRDIRDDQNLKFSLSPKQAKLGIEITRSQSFSASYRPKWISILDQSFSFNSSYKENGDPTIYHGTKSVGNQSGKSANFTFYWQRILGVLKPKAEAKKGISPLNWIRSFVGNLSQNLAALTVNYRITRTSTKSGLSRRPSLSYQFGFTDKADVPFSTDPQTSTSRSDGLSTQRNWDLGSALRLTSNINLSSLRYNKVDNITSGSGAPVRSKSTTFPDMALTWSNLEKFKIFKRFASSVDYSFNYRRKVDTSEDGLTGKLNKKDISKSLTPLSLKVTFNNRVQTNWAWDRVVAESRSLSEVVGAGGKTISTSDAYGVNATYSFSAPKGMKLPFLKKIKFQSNLNLGLGISIRRNQTKSSVGQQGYNVSADSREFSLTPSAAYSFSSQVTGGLSGRWLDTTNKISGEKNHTRELAIWVQVTF